jgi:hypothetical protein
MKIPVQITISRDSNDRIRIELRDPGAVVRFAQIYLAPHDFALALTGLSAIECEADLVALEKVGKVRVHEPRTKVCTDPSLRYDRKKLEQWLLENAQEEGWELNPYLGSQDSTSHDPDGVKLHYWVSRWVVTPQP